jgi:regulatory protein
VAAGERSRPRRPRDEDSRHARAQDSGAPEIVTPRKTLDVKAARLAAGDLLSRRDWTRAGLAARLRRRGAPAAVATEVVDDLVARGYLDDAVFARRWAAARAARGYGAARLRMELRARGVAAPLVAATMEDLCGGEEVLARAREAAHRRLPALRRGRADRVAARLRDYLLRRGFATSVVVRVVRQTIGVAEES